MTRAGRSALFIVMLLVTATAQGLCAYAQSSSYIVRRDSNTAALVFIHGIFGDAASTWKSSNFAWLEALSKDSFFSQFSIYVFSYPSPYAGKTYPPGELADHFMNQLNVDGVLDHKAVVIVAHSMGGLITRIMFLRFRERLQEKVRMLYFYGTPTQGSPIATIGALVSKNPQLGKMYPIDGNTDNELFQMQVNWHAARIRTPTYCAYEKRKTYGVQVVPPESAISLCNSPTTPIDENHIDMVKPASVGDAAYVALKSALKDEGFGPKVAAWGDIFEKFMISYSYYTRGAEGINIALDLSRPLLTQVQLFKGDIVTFGDWSGTTRVRLGGDWLPFEANKQFVVAGEGRAPVLPEFEGAAVKQGTISVHPVDRLAWPRVLEAPSTKSCVKGMSELCTRLEVYDNRPKKAVDPERHRG